MDILFIEKLIVTAIIGIHDWEKKCSQELIFDVELAYDHRKFKEDTGVSSYLDYSLVRAKILDIVSKERFLLIEDVAEVTANSLIRDFCICWTRVTVRKPSAMRDAANVGISIKRKKSKYF